MPSFAENCAASVMPIETPSPWNRRSEKPVAASSAWPKVWPRLSSARSPVSRSSRETTPALARQEVAIACSRAEPPLKDVGMVLLQPGEEGFVTEHAVFGDFGIAGAELRAADSVSSTAVSAITSTGWWKAPSRFLPCGELMPVLPPTEESTCASSEVGTCTKSTPRRRIAAAKPARSPTTPPPSAMTRSLRSIFAAIRASLTFSRPA